MVDPAREMTGWLVGRAGKGQSVDFVCCVWMWSESCVIGHLEMSIQEAKSDLKMVIIYETTSRRFVSVCVFVFVSYELSRFVMSDGRETFAICFAVG